MEHTTLTAQQAEELYTSDKEFPVSIHDASAWIGRRVDNVKKTLVECDGLVEKVDYSIPDFQENLSPLGGRPKVDIYLTVDCFKHLAMMANTERGYEVRSYFLECEERAKQKAQQFEDMVIGASQFQLLVGRQQRTITSLMCTSGAAMTAGQIYSTLFPNDPELTVGEKRLLSRLLGANASVPANAKHFTVPTIDKSAVNDFRFMRMRPLIESSSDIGQLEAGDV